MTDASSPLVSVVMGVCDGERFLMRALDSILVDQEGVSLELIVVDDGSDDATAAILARCGDPRLRVITRQRSGGLAMALNHGVAAAQGRLVARMDADDVSLPGRLRIQTDYMSGHPEAVMASAQVNLIDAEDRVVYEGRYPVTRCQLDFLFLLINPYWHPTVMFRREVFDRVGGYDETLAYAQDYDLWARMAGEGGLAIIDHPLLHYRVHGGGVTQTKFREQEACAAGIIRRNLRAFSGREYDDREIFGMREILHRLPVVHANPDVVAILETLLAEYEQGIDPQAHCEEELRVLVERVADDLLSLAGRTVNGELADVAGRTARDLVARKRINLTP